jgi:hypothetical protein
MYFPGCVLLYRDQGCCERHCSAYATYLLPGGMDKFKLSIHTTEGTRNWRGLPTPRLLALGLLAVAFSLVSLQLLLGLQHPVSSKLPINTSQILEKCRLLDVKPGPPHDFHRRLQSDRFVLGTPPTLIKNASIWTARVSGLEVIVGDLLLDKGLVKSVGNIDQRVLDAYGDNLVTTNVQGAWVSPG